VLKGLVDL
jgi:tetratricopeptide repeat protein 21B